MHRHHMPYPQGMKPRIIAGVMGSSRDDHEDLAAPLGAFLAREGYHLLTGGGGGVMESVSRAFVETPGRKGVCLGVLRAETSCDLDPDTGRRPDPGGTPNPHVEIAIRTHLPLSGDDGRSPLSRNHINVLTAHVLIALPGTAGTLSEVDLRLQYGRPVILMLGDRTVNGIPASAFPRGERS